MVGVRRAFAGVLAAGALLLNTSAVFAQEAVEDPFLVPMVGNQFTKPELTVPVGTTVTWLNADAEQHNVIERTAILFESPLINQGESWAMTFDTPGSYQYVCDLHANMEGVVVVLAPTAAAEEPAA
jgi:plastocyanin